MNTFQKRFVRSLVAGTVTMATFIGTAYADGLKSQWKTRLPMPTGLVEVKREKWAPFFPEPKKLKVENIDTAVPRLITQRKERLQTRILKKDVNETNQKNEKVSESAFGELEKIRSIKKMQKPANKCATLHTHERARCLRDQSYRGTNQYRAHVAKTAPGIVVANAR